MTKIVLVQTVTNINSVAQLAETIWKEHYTPIIGSAQVDYMLDKFQSAAAVQDQIDHGVKYYLLQFQKEFVGYFSFRIEEDHLFLSKLYVLRSARGNGVARAALTFIGGQAVENKVHKIQLTVNKHNSNSITAYEKMGFITVNSIVQDIGNGFVMDDYVLEKKIE